MKTKRKIGAVLIAILALALLPAAVFASPHHVLPAIVALGMGIAGTVTVTYSSFAVDQPSPQVGTAYTGGTTAPSAIQAGQVNRLNALVGFTDGDTSITLTHNWGLSAAAQAANEPDIIVTDYALGSSGTTPAGMTWARNTNTVVGSKGTAAGSGRTLCVTLRLPATPGN
jgi:hypothetical protein